jgi:hypothetical protein
MGVTADEWNTIWSIGGILLVAATFVGLALVGTKGMKSRARTWWVAALFLAGAVPAAIAAWLWRGG